MFGDIKSLKSLNKVIKFSKSNKIKKGRLIYCPPYTLISSFLDKFKNCQIDIGGRRWPPQFLGEWKSDRAALFHEFRYMNSQQFDRSDLNFIVTTGFFNFNYLLKKPNPLGSVPGPKSYHRNYSSKRDESLLYESYVNFNPICDSNLLIVGSLLVGFRKSQNVFYSSQIDFKRIS